LPAAEGRQKGRQRVKKARFSEEQILGILKQHETADLCREHNISAATFYAWKAKYA